MSFASKVALVSGASGGIGSAIATSFAKRGADVVLVGRNEEKLEKIAKECQEYGRKRLVVKADITKDDQVENVVKKTIDKFGKIDILVNGAGILRMATLEKDKNVMDIFDEVMAINVRAAVSLMKEATPHLIASKGNVVNISTVGGQQVFAEYMLSYSTSKAALDMCSRAAAIELGKHGVRVNIVSPGAVLKTGLLVNAGIDPSLTADDLGFRSLLGRWSDRDEIADLVAFLASDSARGITGSNYVCDNGYLNVKLCKK